MSRTDRPILCVFEYLAQPCIAIRLNWHSHLTDGTTSHSTRLPKDGSQVAGYKLANALHSHSAKSPKDGDISRWLTPTKSLVSASQVAGYRVNAEDAVGIGDQCGDLARFIGIFLIFLGAQEAFFFQDRMQLAKRFKNFSLAVKLHIKRFGKQVCQHQMMSRAAAYPCVAVTDMQNLVMRRIQMRGQANIAEGGQGIGGDSGDTIFYNGDDGGHD